MKTSSAQLIRKAVAKALGIKVKDLGCFTITDHDDDPMTVLMHGGPHQGIHTEARLKYLHQRIYEQSKI